MIPKTIHYCWFGRGPLPKLAIKCIDSWKKYCPGYEIVEWNEDNFDVCMNGYTKMCYEQKKWAYLSDYARLFVVHQNGGAYFDTDVELVRSPDSLLQDEAFFGFETDSKRKKHPGQADSQFDSDSGCVATGLGFGSVARGLGVGEMMNEYVPLLDGQHGVTGCPELNTRALVRLGLKRDGTLQRFDWGTVYPIEYLNPYESTTGRLKRTEKTVSIHWYMGSALTTQQRIKSIATKPLHRVLGVDCFDFLKRKT